MHREQCSKSFAVHGVHPQKPSKGGTMSAESHRWGRRPARQARFPVGNWPCTRRSGRPVRRGPVQPPRQPDRAGRRWLGPRFEVALLLHPGERDIHGAAFDDAPRPFRQIQAKGLTMGELPKDDRFETRKAWNIRCHLVIIELTLCKSSVIGQLYTLTILDQRDTLAAHKPPSSSRP